MDLRWSRCNRQINLDQCVKDNILSYTVLILVDMLFDKICEVLQEHSLLGGITAGAFTLFYLLDKKSKGKYFTHYEHYTMWHQHHESCIYSLVRWFFHPLTVINLFILCYCNSNMPTPPSLSQTLSFSVLLSCYMRSSLLLGYKGRFIPLYETAAGVFYSVCCERWVVCSISFQGDREGRGEERRGEEDCLDVCYLVL